jgi:selenocysteine lyase/cysteine desulfurase
LSFKPLFSRSLGADPERLHFAAHSHHLWPDASFAGQVAAWNDAARLADRKWDRIMGEVWPEAQAHVARELGTGDPSAIVFASNTHDFLIRLITAAPARGDGPLRVLTTDGEFHSARRQFARWAEAGWIALERVAVEPFDTFSERFMQAASADGHDLIVISQVMFGSGKIFDRVDELAMLARKEGPWVVIDGYHAFMALNSPFGDVGSGFYLGGGYKYAMAGEGVAFLHAPPDFGPRPPVTGWFAEFEDLSLPPGSVGYAKDASRFMGATFDPSGLYRFNFVQRTLADNDLTTLRISRHVEELQHQLLESIYKTPLSGAELLNPLDRDKGDHARFLAFRSPEAQRWHADLKARNCITDVRGDVLRIGFGLYQDESDVDRLLELLYHL